MKPVAPTTKTFLLKLILDDVEIFLENIFEKF